MARTSPAKEEIEQFLQSGEAGQTTELSMASLKNAASSMYTANGLNCPVKFIRVKGQTLILNREMIAKNGSA